MTNKAYYEQSTGLLLIDTPMPFRAIGYAGTGPGRNNAALDGIRNVGPLPKGRYRVSLPFDHPTKGPFVFRLTPFPENDMKGRSGFLIHGDNARGDASEGCIVMAKFAREVLARHRVRELEVVSLLKRCVCNEAEGRAAVAA